MRGLILLVLTAVSFLSHAETWTVGIPPFTPPFVMNADDKGHYIGFSIEIMSTICKRLNITCHYKPLGFENSFTEVMNHSVDLAIGNFTITPEREQYVSFSLPYLRSDAAIITLNNSPITSVDNLRGKRIGAEYGSIFIPYIEKKFDTDVQVISYRIISESMFDLSNGDLDAVILDKQTAQFWVGNNNALFKIIASPLPIGLGIGMMTQKDNTGLLQRINQTLVSMEIGGAYLKIYHTYFGDT